MSLQITDVRKRFGRVPALEGVSLEAVEGEFVALLGPSGSGKTTLLRVIAGLEIPESGAVRFKGEDLLGKPVRRRRIGFVFQSYALFRHMTAARNIAFGLEAKPRAERPDKAAIAARVEELLALVQLEGLGGRYPAQLSGGQRQRVALARALAIEPRLLLLDEPFGALDAKVRRELRRWLKELHGRTGLTTIFVTHDQEEALELADRIALLRAGRLEQVGAPEDLYHAPANAFVFDFLGEAVRLPCVVENGAAFIGGARAEIRGAPPAAGPAIAHARPDAIGFTLGEGPGARATLRDVITAGPRARLDCVLDTGEAVEIRADHSAVVGVAPGARLALQPSVVWVWPEHGMFG